MSDQRQPTEEEMRAAYEAEIKKIRVEHILLEHAVSLVNLGMRRTGLAPGTEDERDPEQVRVAIEAVRAVLPLLEGTAPDQVGPIRQALSQLQLAYVRVGGREEAAAAGAAPGAQEAGTAGESEEAGATDPGAAGSEAADSAESGAEGAGPGSQPKPEGPGPAQRSGRLWVPGQ
jgi:hypothetical protein